MRTGRVLRAGTLATKLQAAALATVSRARASGLVPARGFMPCEPRPSAMRFTTASVVAGPRFAGTRAPMSAAEMMPSASTEGSLAAASTALKPPMLWPMRTMRFGSRRRRLAFAGTRR